MATRTPPRYVPTLTEVVRAPEAMPSAAHAPTLDEEQWVRRIMQRVELTLDRLDFGADIFLNGERIGRQMSVHFPFVCDVRAQLRPGANTLAVRLTCGLERVSEEDLASIDWAVCTEEGNGCPERGDRRRAFLRKP